MTSTQTCGASTLASTKRLVDQCRHLHLTEGNRFTAQLATTEEVRQAAYRLRYDAYLSCGHISDTGDGLLHDEFDDSGGSRTIVVYKGDVVVASVRVCFLDSAFEDSPRNTIPSAKAFPNDIKSALRTVRRTDRPERAIEITKLVRSADCAGSRGLTFMIFKLIGYLIMDFNADIIFAAVCEKHIKFYQRIGFGSIAEPRLYPGLQNVTGHLLACSREIHQNMQERLPRIVAARKNDPLYRRFIQGDLISIFPDLAPPRLIQAFSPVEPSREAERSDAEPALAFANP